MICECGDLLEVPKVSYVKPKYPKIPKDPLPSARRTRPPAPKPRLPRLAAPFPHTLRNMPGQPDISGVTSFDKSKLKKAETAVKNTLPTADDIANEKNAS